MAKTYVYVDGFNTYFGLFKDPPPKLAKYKWMNPVALCRRLFPGDAVEKLKYFTARVSSPRNDPSQHLRQDIYFTALADLPEVEIVEGKFQGPIRTEMKDWVSGESVFVAKTVEKGSDVNLASHLLLDAFKKRFEKAVIVSNDSDLITPAKMVKEHFGLQIEVINPSPSLGVLTIDRRPNRKISEEDLAACQFVSPLTLRNGKQIHKPPSWA